LLPCAATTSKNSTCRRCTKVLLAHESDTADSQG
jgi:hypothetical protein